MNKHVVIPLILLVTLAACDGRDPSPAADANGGAVVAPVRPERGEARPAMPDPRKPVVGTPDPEIQSVLDAVPERMRGDVATLAACRAMGLKSVPSPEERATALRRAAADVAANPTAARKCMSSIGARSGPPTPRTRADR